MARVMGVSILSERESIFSQSPVSLKAFWAASFSRGVFASCRVIFSKTVPGKTLDS